jgi:hypothetical protein
MKITTSRAAWPVLAYVALLWAMLSAGPAAQAFEGRQGGAPGAVLPQYAQECGACHLAYPPGLLPRASWQRLLSGLDRHFGADASLDPATAASIARWLAANARGQGDSPAPADRITKSAWFLREHREAVDRLPGGAPVRFPDCAACHSGAAQARFDDE